MSIIKPNSIPNEYYLGDLPGTLQYKKTKAELSTITNLEEGADCGYVQLAPTAEILARLIPNTPTGRKGDWELVLAMESRSLEGEIWLKGALLDKKTGLIALMTSTNGEKNITSRGNRAMKSHADSWFIGRYRMGAPMIFWQTLAKVCSAL